MFYLRIVLLSISYQNNPLKAPLICCSDHHICVKTLQLYLTPFIHLPILSFILYNKFIECVLCTKHYTILGSKIRDKKNRTRSFYLIISVLKWNRSRKRLKIWKIDSLILSFIFNNAEHWNTPRGFKDYIFPPCLINK